MRNFEDRDREAAATALQRRLHREERHRAKKRKAIRAAVAFSIAGVVLLGGGLAALVAARRPAPGPAASATASPAPAKESLAQVSSASSDSAEASAATDSTQPHGVPRTVSVAKVPKPAPNAARTPSRTTASTPVNKTQHFSIAIGAVGYEPSYISAKSGSPITLTVGKGEGCAAGFNMPSLGVHADNSAGAVTVRLGTLKRGAYVYTCSMGMVSGKLMVR